MNHRFYVLKNHWRVNDLLDGKSAVATIGHVNGRRMCKGSDSKDSRIFIIGSHRKTEASHQNRTAVLVIRCARGTLCATSGCDAVLRAEVFHL